ncbi:MAG: hypothetical protein ACNI27_02030 [Desulfovibrio sp.]
MKLITTCLALLTVLFLLASSVMAQEELAGANRYKMREASNGYYEEYEVKPGRASPFLQSKSVDMRRSGTYSKVTFQKDAHAGVANYKHQRCESCHTMQARNSRHVTRENIQCVQCHSGDVVSGVNYYYSPLNPIRRHAYVCAKCHQGAGGSFAMYVLHEPVPVDKGTASSFPELYWAVWIMLYIAVATFVFFLPHTVLWMLRELWGRTEKEGGRS